MKHEILQAVTSAALFLYSSYGCAAQGEESVWPCIQRETGSLSAGILWPRPVEGVEALAPDAEALVVPLALRRVPLDDAQAAVEAYAAGNADAAQVDAVFEAVFTRINRDRDRVLGGIRRYAQSQIALSRRIDAAQAELADLTAANSQDFDRFDALEEQLAWDERIFRDRERSLTYVCETPVLLEKRAYAVAQMLLPLVTE